MNIQLESPFKYRICDITTANEKHSISLKEINKLIFKKKISYIDLEILKTLYEFKYLNRHNLERYINSNSDIAEDLKKHDYKKSVSRLMKYGLVLRYYFYWNAINDNKLYDQSPNFYSLSRGALHYLIKRYRYKVNIDEFLLLESPENAMRKLAFNQAYINIRCHYQKQLMKEYIEIKATNKPIKTFIPGIFYFCLDDHTIAPFILVSIRRTHAWEQDLINDLDVYNEFIDKKKLYRKKDKQVLSSPIFIAICEDDLHVKDTHEYLCSSKSTTYNMLYTTDIITLKDKLFDKLYMCESYDGETIMQLNTLSIFTQT